MHMNWAYTYCLPQDMGKDYVLNFFEEAIEELALIHVVVQRELLLRDTAILLTYKWHTVVELSHN